MAYFLAITFFLAFVFNVVEFFEKLMRSSQANVFNIGYFVCLNFFSSLAELMPVGAWLASCLLIRELIQFGEWETLQILGIDFKGLLKGFLYASLLVMLCGSLLNELLLRPMANKAEQYRQVTFKGRRTDSIFDRWYKLDNTTFCYVKMLDFKQNKGSDLIFLYMTDDFSLHKVVTVNSFNFDNVEKTIFVTEGSQLTATTFLDETTLNGKALYEPMFFGQVYLNMQQFSIVEFIKYYAFSDAFESLGINRNLWILFWEQVLFYLQAVFFSVLVTAVFILLEQRLYGRWGAMLMVYPLYTVLTMFLHSLFNGYAFLYSIALLYFSLLVMLGFLYKKRYV